MDSNTIRQTYLNFFQKQNHTIIPPAPLIPENDPTTLFTSSGMQQLVPYLKGETHPMGTRLTDSQPSFRAEDIDEVGDNRHTTFFEMLGNWSLGDYFKKEQLSWFYLFLTQEIKLDPARLYVTVFEGNDIVPRDDESISIWQQTFNTPNPAKKGIEGFDSNIKIYLYDAKKNWWSRSGTPDKMPVGEIGGPDSEVFYDFDPDGTKAIHQNSPYKDQPCHPNCDCGRFLEIGNSVFMQYVKTDEGFKPLPKQNVDFGGGLERLAAASNDNPDVFKTSLLWLIVEELEALTGKSYTNEFQKPLRIVADHLRAACFMISQGIEPSNKAQGYILRRLIRRSLVKLSTNLNLTSPDFKSLANKISSLYETPYPQFHGKAEYIAQVLNKESQKFSQTLKKGLQKLESQPIQSVNANFAFDLFQTYGFPFEVTQEILSQKNIKISKEEFDKEFKAHQEKSRTASKGLFKGGLENHSEIITKYHTATHLLHQALRQVVGNHVQQAGSNITAQRLRFDFTNPTKLTPEQIEAVQKLVNEKIQENLPVTMEITTLENAQKEGALAFFSDRYSDKVKVYTIGNFSKEVCGGPHVENTGSLGQFIIKKQESIGAGKIRIYGLLD
jgi:alanyl-tRNA synthetase